MRLCAQCAVQYPDALEYCPHDGSKLPEPAGGRRGDPLVGTTIDGRYLVEALLGQGGMGHVYAARHAIIDKRVAIKVLRPDSASNDPSAATRFLDEAKAASKIGHQNIVDITDFGVLPDGQAYFVMEFLDGPTLGKIVHEAGTVGARRAVSITVQIARGLQAAHDKGIIHRDLKPENVFVLERDGQSDVVKIVDFGIAKDQKAGKKLTQAGMVLGTPEYMSPEQATGQPTDGRVDMYALGCILYEMLTGDVPFRGENATKTLTQHVFDAVVPPSERRPDLAIPPALEAVVMRMLAKKPTDRYADLRELMGALDAVDGQLAGRAPSAPPRPAKVVPPTVAVSPLGSESELLAAVQPRRAPLLVGGAILGLALVGGIALLATRGKPTAAPPAPTPIVEATPAPTPAAPVAAPATPPAAKMVDIVLRSRPSGAEVWEAGRRLGSTPLTVSRAHGEGALAFVFRQAGYRDETRELVPSSDKELEVVLEPKHVALHKPTTSVSVAHPATSGPAPAQSPAQGPGTKSKPRTSDLRNPFE